MKFENNNKEIIKKITNRSLKSNKTRNIFVVIAIVLTTFMLTCVFTLGISFNENYQLMNLRDAGTTVNTYLNNPTEKQISKIKNLNITDSIGREISVGASRRATPKKSSPACSPISARTNICLSSPLFS